MNTPIETNLGDRLAVIEKHLAEVHSVLMERERWIRVKDCCAILGVGTTVFYDQHVPFLNNRMGCRYLRSEVQSRADRMAKRRKRRISA